MAIQTGGWRPATGGAEGAARALARMLAVLRRYAGLCKACVAKRAKHRPPPRPMRIVRSFVRHGERYHEIECGCGARRVMRQSTYVVQRPQSCKRCRLRAVAKHGFEAEYARPKPRRVLARRRDR